MSILRDTLVSAFPKPPSGKVLTIDSKLSVASAHAVRRARAPPSKSPPIHITRKQPRYWSYRHTIHVIHSIPSLC